MVCCVCHTVSLTNIYYKLTSKKILCFCSVECEKEFFNKFGYPISTQEKIKLWNETKERTESYYKQKLEQERANA